ncbi:hypothetical protein BDV29DRAFT_154851 [Aspergillus leporis]|uniref:Uncharacterized protein n=1 Tax=Aspergillus leporis TaxID=41062 RepID=A0A5N5X9N1_9EURO|nr:hypothetical protein BDV29DRAFT_154851 [Aspergillus leporis]
MQLRPSLTAAFLAIAACAKNCGPACQANLQHTNAANLKTFGASPKRNNSQISGGASVYKFQYTSQDANGSPVPATGFTTLPFVRRHKDPFKLVAFAHGTTGVFRGCAPSTASYLYDYNIWTPLLSVGYAVVATNYVGLRNGMSKHKYIASAANTIVVYWSIAAALKAFPNDLTPSVTPRVAALCTRYQSMNWFGKTPVDTWVTFPLLHHQALRFSYRKL